MKTKQKIIPILEGYDADNFGSLIELAVRLKRINKQWQGYQEHIQRRIDKIMQPARTRLELFKPNTTDI